MPSVQSPVCLVGEGRKGLFALKGILQYIKLIKMKQQQTHIQKSTRKEQVFTTQNFDPRIRNILLLKQSNLR